MLSKEVLIIYTLCNYNWNMTKARIGKSGDKHLFHKRLHLKVLEPFSGKSLHKLKSNNPKSYSQLEKSTASFLQKYTPTSQTTTT